MEELGREEERNRNRATLAELHESHQDLLDQFAAFRNDVRAQVDTFAAQFGTLEQEVHGCRTGVEKVTADHQQLRQEHRATHEKVVEKIGWVSEETTSHYGAVKADLRKYSKEATSDVMAVREDLKKHRDELSKTKSQQRALLEQQQRSGSSDLAVMEVRELRRQLWNRGVLQPAKEEPPEEGQPPPVGTLELGEDVFTARLLFRLGFLKQQYDAVENGDMSLNSDMSDFEESSEFGGKPFDHVTGIAVPEIRPGGPGYFKVVYGIIAICLATFAIQFVSLAFMLRSGVDVGSTDGCFETPPGAVRWWSLHLSKLLAMCVAGTLMGKDLLNVINYWMAAKILMPNHMWEATFTAFVRIGMRIVIVAVNVVIFLTLTNAADVWMNMTALDFVATLCDDMLVVIRSGVFGHDLAQAAIPLSFQLTFVSTYPRWFKPMRNLALLVSFCMVAVFAVVTFQIPDRICEEG